MSKDKSLLDDVRSKLFNRKETEAEQQAQAEVEASLENETFDVIQDPSTKSRQFLIVKLKYNLDTKQASVVDVAPFQDKAAGLAITNDKTNLKFFYDKNTRGRNNENK